MELTLDRSDLKPEFSEIACSATKHKHFSEPAQQAIHLVGKGMFTTNGGTNHNVVYSPHAGARPAKK